MVHPRQPIPVSLVNARPAYAPLTRPPVAAGGLPAAASAERTLLLEQEVAVCMRQLVCMLVAHPVEVSAVIVSDNHHSTLALRVHREDLGVVIGRKGRTARSLRVLLVALASRLGSPVTLDIASSGN